MAALMGSLGYALVADDIVPVSFREGSPPGAWPFLRRLKLQLDPIVQLALPSTELVSETFDNRKYFVSPKITAEDGSGWSGSICSKSMGQPPVPRLIELLVQRRFG